MAELLKFILSLHKQYDGCSRDPLEEVADASYSRSGVIRWRTHVGKRMTISYQAMPSIYWRPPELDWITVLFRSRRTFPWRTEAGLLNEDSKRWTLVKSGLLDGSGAERRSNLFKVFHPFFKWWNKHFRDCRSRIIVEDLMNRNGVNNWRAEFDSMKSVEGLRKSSSLGLSYLSDFFTYLVTGVSIRMEANSFRLLKSLLCFRAQTHHSISIPLLVFGERQAASGFPSHLKLGKVKSDACRLQTQHFRLPESQGVFQRKEAAG